MTITATIAGCHLDAWRRFGIIFGGGHRDSSNSSDLGVIGTLAMVVPTTPSPPCSCRSQSAARVNTPPTIWVRNQRESARACLGAGENRRGRPSGRELSGDTTRRPRTCSSSIRCPARMDNLFSTHPATENRTPLWKAFAAEIGSARAAPRPGSSRPPAGPWGRRSSLG